MTGTGPAAGFLAAARDACLLVEVDGGCLVADRYDDPVLGRAVWLVEHVTPGLLGAGFPSVLASARRRAGVDLPETLVRVPPDRHPPGSEHHSHYVRLRCDADRRPVPAVPVRPATPQDDPVVAGWLRTALCLGYAARGATPPPGRISAGVAALLADAGRESLVAEVGGHPVGHLTLLSGHEDPVTGEAPIELFDVLVEDVDGRRDIEAALVGAAHRLARDRGADLLGSVVCEPAGADGGRRCGRVLAALAADGWQPDHDYVRMGAP